MAVGSNSQVGEEGAAAGKPTRGVFFDRDNTLIVADGYLGDPELVRLMPGAAEAVARARRLGMAVVVVSNQSGVGRGIFTEDAVHAVNRRMDELLVAENADALIDVHYFCPYHPAAVLPQYRMDSDLRKPKPGMILEGMKELGLTGGFCIGDAPRDVAAGRAAKLTTFLFTPPGVTPSPAAAQELDVGPDYRTTSLQEAMDIIERLTTARPAPQGSTGTKAPGDTGGGTVDLSRIEKQLEQIVVELKKQGHGDGDFSVARLMAGIVQVMAIAVLLMMYLNVAAVNPVLMLLFAIFLQALVTSLVLMGRKG